MVNVTAFGNRKIGAGQPAFIIAEAGVNHNGDVELAKRLIKEAKVAGADAVKFQTFSTESVIIKDAPKAQYQMQTTEHSESQYDMLEKLRLTEDEFIALKKYADHIDIAFLSTPCDKADVDLLVSIGVSVLKIASMDIVNYPFLDYVGRQGIPVIVSTGMATLGEIEKSLEVLGEAGCAQVILLHCVTNYPIEDYQANLRVMDTLVQAFQVPVGFSDHTRGVVVPIAAVARGACLIEKHFTLDRNMIGPDHTASLDPTSFQYMVNGIRAVESALGDPVKRPQNFELENRIAMRRSLVAARDIPAGTVLETHHFAMKRPGSGLGAGYIPLFVGKRTSKAVSKDEIITCDILLP